MLVDSWIRTFFGDNADRFAKHFGNTPLLGRTSEAGAPPLISIGEIDQLISGGLVHFPDVSMVKDGQPIEEAQFTRPPNAERGGARVIDAGRVFELFGSGATIQLQGAQLRSRTLDLMCRQLEAEVGARTQANVYLTPAAATGFDIHFDTHDVIVVQVSGAKRWRVYEPTIRLPLEQHSDMPFDEPAEPLLDTILHEGDSLYVPRGYLHRVTGVEEVASIHLTIGVLTHSWLEAFQEVLRYAEGVPAFRATMPVGADDRVDRGASVSAEELAEQLRALAQWFEDLDPSQAKRWIETAFWGSRPRALHGQLGQLLNLELVDDLTKVRRRPATPAFTSTLEDRLIVSFADVALDMPGWLSPAVEDVLARTEPFRPCDLDDSLDAESRVVLVQRLVREGLLIAEERDV